MLAGNPLPQFVTYFVPAPRSPLQITYSHMLAADLDARRLPPQGTPEYAVHNQASNLGFPAERLQVYEFHVDWNSPPSSTLTPTASLIPEPFNSHACTSSGLIKQRGTTNRLDSLSYGYMMQRLTYRNLVPYQTLLFNHTVAADRDQSHNHAGIRWSELRKPIIRERPRSPWEIYQQGTYAPDANDRWLGSIAMDVNGNIALGFGVSCALMYPSLHYAGQQPTDPLGMLPLGELSLIDGGGAQLQEFNFGDYSQMTIDPVDDCTFWYTGTYYRRTTTHVQLAHADWVVQICGLPRQVTTLTRLKDRSRGCWVNNGYERVHKSRQGRNIMKNHITMLMVILLVVACFALPPDARAVSPPPGGCYPNYTTAEGCNALAFLTTGIGNTAVGSVFSVVSSQ